MNSTASDHASHTTAQNQIVHGGTRPNVDSAITYASE